MASRGADPGPWFWAPALRYLRAAVIDGDPLEGFRLARQHAGGEPGTATAWMTLPSARTAGVWVTDSSPAGLARTLEAMTAAESCGLPMQQIVVAVNDAHGHGWAPRSRSRRTLLADRVGAIVEIGHDAELRRGDRPSATRAAGRSAMSLPWSTPCSPRPGGRRRPGRRPRARARLRRKDAVACRTSHLSQLAASAHPGTAHAIRSRCWRLAPAACRTPLPASPGPAAAPSPTLLSWVKWLALAACAASAVAAGGMIAVGSVTRRAELAERGKDSLLWSVIGAVIVAIGIPLVNHAFQLGLTRMSRWPTSTGGAPVAGTAAGGDRAPRWLARRRDRGPRAGGGRRQRGPGDRCAGRRRPTVKPGGRAARRPVPRSGPAAAPATPRPQRTGARADPARGALQLVIG